MSRFDAPEYQPRNEVPGMERSDQIGNALSELTDQHNWHLTPDEREDIVRSIEHIVVGDWHDFISPDRNVYRITRRTTGYEVTSLGKAA